MKNRFFMVALMAVMALGTVNNVKAESITMAELEQITLESHHNGMYADCGLITEIDEENDIVYFTMQNGNEFSFYGVEDYFINDLVSVIMDDNGTAKVEDDIILYSRYSGWISEEEAATWIK